MTLNSSPLLRYLDPFVILDRHYFAPRAKSDEELYFCFRGGWYNLSERFTDFTKVLLLCTFYSVFMPMIWWLGAAILFFQCKIFAVFSLTVVPTPIPIFCSISVPLNTQTGWTSFSCSGLGKRHPTKDLVNTLTGMHDSSFGEDLTFLWSF